MPVLDIAGAQQNVNMFGAYQQGKAMRIAEENEARKMEMEQKRLELSERQVATQEGRLEYDKNKLDQAVQMEVENAAAQEANKMFESEEHRAAMQGFQKRIIDGDPNADAELDDYVKNNFPNFYKVNKPKYEGKVTTPEEAQRGYDQIDFIDQKLAKGTSVSAALQELNIRNDIETRFKEAGGIDQALASGAISKAEESFYKAGLAGATAGIQNAEAIAEIMESDLPQEYKDAMVKSLGGYIDQSGGVKITEELAESIANDMIDAEMPGLEGFEGFFGGNDEMAVNLLTLEILQRVNKGESIEEAQKNAVASVQRQLTQISGGNADNSGEDNGEAKPTGQTATNAEGVTLREFSDGSWRP